jgi:hypothetical protein
MQGSCPSPISSTQWPCSNFVEESSSTVSEWPSLKPQSATMKWSSSTVSEWPSSTVSEWPSSTVSEWPSLKPQSATLKWSSSTVSEWPSLKPQSATMKCSISAEEQVRFAAVQLQQKVLEAFREFCAGNAASDNDEDEGKVGSEECEEFKFFLKVFKENSELRSYYENNFEGGEFCCLVCGGIGKKVWRRFKDGLGLLQHSITIKNTKYKQAHRAYAQVICKVLGWDIDQDCVQG